MNEPLYFEKITEHRGIFFVEYRPPASDHQFATLNLIFPGNVDLSKLAVHLRAELGYWLRRYPVPLMIWAWDQNEGMLCAGPDGESCLLGWLTPHTTEIVDSWKIKDFTAFLKSQPAHDDWQLVYKDVPFRTDKQVKKSAAHLVNKIRKRNRYLKTILFIWLAVIPAGWALLQYAGLDWLALIVLVYAFVQASRAGYRIWKNSQPSAREKAATEKQTTMNHYYYHCELNPDGFARLKAENFANEATRNIENESAAIAGKTNQIARVL